MSSGRYRETNVSLSEWEVCNRILGEHTVAIAALDAALNRRTQTMKMLRKTARKWGFAGGLVGGLAAGGVHFLGACAAATPAPADLAAYQRAQMACVDGNDSRQAIDDCRARARADWCARFPSMVDCDGGVHDDR